MEVGLAVTIAPPGPTQAWLDAPVQLAPPFAGAGLVQVRVWVPEAPHCVALQELQSLHPPFTTRPVVVKVTSAP